MVIEFQERRSDVLMAILFILRYSRRTQFILLGVSVLPSIAYLVSRYLSRGFWVLNDFVIAGVYGLGLFLALIVVSIFTNKIGEITLFINQDGIVTKVGSRERVFPWKMVARIVTKNNQVLILGKKGNALLIPSSAFTDDEARTRFVKLAVQHHVEAGG